MLYLKPRIDRLPPPPQEAHYFDSARMLLMMQSEGCSRAEMARRTGLTVVQVINRLRLLELDEGLRGYLRQEGVPEGIALTLLRLPDPVTRRRMAYRIIRERLCIRDAALLVGSAGRRCQQLPPAQHEQRVITVIRDVRPYRNAIRDIAEQMKNAGVRATYAERRTGGMLELTVSYPARRRRVERFHSM